MHPAQILVHKRFSSSDIRIEVLPDAEWKANSAYDQQVAEAWKEKERLAKEDNAKIWDGMYYRVANASEIEESGELVLRLGTIPYRYIATAANLKSAFLEHDLPLPFHLSTTAIICTSDGSYLFGKRSRNGAIDLIGGGAQPDEIAIVTGADLEKNLRKEMLEEAGVGQSHVQSVEGIGIVRSATSNVLVIYFVQLHLSEREVGDVFRLRLDDEMSELIFVPEGEIKPALRGMTSYQPLIAELL